MTCQTSVADVDSMLVSAGAIVDTGHLVQLGPNAEDCWMYNMRTHNYTTIKREGKVFRLGLNILEPPDGHKSMMNLEAGNKTKTVEVSTHNKYGALADNPSQVFQRQAR